VDGTRGWYKSYNPEVKYGFFFASSERVAQPPQIPSQPDVWSTDCFDKVDIIFDKVDFWQGGQLSSVPSAASLVPGEPETPHPQPYPQP
jgi:hypothetical protein